MKSSSRQALEALTGTSRGCYRCAAVAPPPAASLQVDASFGWGTSSGERATYGLAVAVCWNQGNSSMRLWLTFRLLTANTEVVAQVSVCLPLTVAESTAVCTVVDSKRLEPDENFKTLP